MLTPNQIYQNLQAQYGDYGEYVLLHSPYYSNSQDSCYRAAAVTLDEIKQLQADGYTSLFGYPDASECGYLLWDVLNADADDESDACDWDKWHAYDSYGSYVKSATKQPNN